MRRGIVLLALLVSGATTSSATAAQPGDLVVKKVRSHAADADRVELMYVRQYDPLPKALGAPSECDWLGYLRYRLRTGPASASRADAVMLAMPGNLGGALEFDIVARNVLRKAARRGYHVEWWSLDRRSNCLEDHTGLDAAAAAGDWRIAADYYSRAKEVDGKRFAGFRTSADMPYLAEFGVARTMDDQYSVIKRGIPDQAVRARKVFCGGHSHGGFLTGIYASWDFDGDAQTTSDAGYQQCAGYFALDTSVTDELPGAGGAGPVGDVLAAATTTGTRTGALPRNEVLPPVVTPETFALAWVAGLAAYFEPDRQADFARLPSTPTIELAMRTMFSRDATVFATGRPSMRDFRLTHEAVLASIIDDNSQPLVQAFTASLGTYDGGPVVQKDFVVPNALKDIAGISDVLGVLAGATALPPATKLMIPETPNGPLYGWRNYDRVGALDAPRQLDASGRPFTTPASEITDIHDFARQTFDSPVDFIEMYMPVRLVLETVAALGGARSGDLDRMRYPDGPRRRPYVEILGGESATHTLGRLDIGPGAKPRRRVNLTGYNHLDVTTAAEHQNGGKPEGSSEALVEFVTEVVGAAAPLPAIRLSVTPRQVRSSERVRMRFRVRSAEPGCRAGVRITFAGRRVRTDSKGRASLTVALRRHAGKPVRRRAVARKAGCRRGATFVRIKATVR